MTHYHKCYRNARAQKEISALHMELGRDSHIPIVLQSLVLVSYATTWHQSHLLKG